MRRWKIAAIVLFTVVTAIQLALGFSGVVNAVHVWLWPSRAAPVPSLSDLLALSAFFLALAAGTAAVWFYGVRPKLIGNQTPAWPRGWVPRGKYAVWARDLVGRRGRPIERGRLRSYKTLRRKD